MTHITAELFSKRFVTLVQQSRGLPKKPQDRHILWIGASSMLEPGRSYSEADLNERLSRWCSRFGEQVELDHVTLRRYLIDAGYIDRDSAGNIYMLAQTPPDWSHDPEIRTLDLDLLVLEAERERAARKAQYMQKGRP